MVTSVETLPQISATFSERGGPHRPGEYADTLVIRTASPTLSWHKHPPFLRARPSAPERGDDRDSGTP
eukprot:CAMPEP_0113314026 /NCGR_PEP_ID=MMETSP0010_2-20120614/10240_1 /TAXON_ID=216773 ORGANISM="Corethron hystrix, Strain 308" /NCGR_SAMPLE_ID=MMETSP0010_2 /ASSEMBLY_ACC=CAM_ASM_000155 /LENGTH=67 /DNA_ID=CAMNT_0000170207 /DNA_START=411 /DNA_END=611 /DNA_ORIENTATION=+ /assembly_acc=CAM_ASM_000155